MHAPPADPPRATPPPPSPQEPGLESSSQISSECQSASQRISAPPPRPQLTILCRTRLDALTHEPAVLLMFHVFMLHFFPFSIVRNVNKSFIPFSPNCFPYPSGINEIFDGRMSFTSPRAI